MRATKYVTALLLLLSCPLYASAAVLGPATAVTGISGFTFTSGATTYTYDVNFIPSSYDFYQSLNPTFAGNHQLALDASISLAADLNASGATGLANAIPNGQGGFIDGLEIAAIPYDLQVLGGDHYASAFGVSGPDPWKRDATLCGTCGLTNGAFLINTQVPYYYVAWANFTPVAAVPELPTSCSILIGLCFVGVIQRRRGAIAG